MKIINVVLSGLFVFLSFCVDAKPRKKIPFDDEEYKKKVEAFRQKNAAANTQVKSKEIKPKIDPIDAQCKKIYVNISRVKQEQKTRKYYSSNGILLSTKNVTELVGDVVTYSFKLIRKIDDRSGYFRPIRRSHVYHAGGTDKIYTDEEDAYIVIVNYDLSDYVDNDVIELKDNEKLYSIGTYRDTTRHTYRKFTFNRNDVVKFLNQKK